MTLKMNFAAELQRGERIVRNWLERVNDVERQEESLCGLRIALQCGGSDAFSGISANPLLGSVAKKVICHGPRRAKRSKYHFKRRKGFD